MAARFRVNSTHPEDLACGQVAAPGEVTSKVKTSDPHDKRLIEAGRLVELAPIKRQPPKSEKEEDSQ
jgi:hypothetical protein